MKRYVEIWATTRGPSAPRLGDVGRCGEMGGDMGHHSRPVGAPMQSWYRPTYRKVAKAQGRFQEMPRCSPGTAPPRATPLQSSGRCASCLRVGRDARDLGRLHLAADGAHHAHVMTPTPPEYRTQVCCARDISREILGLRAERLSRRDRRAGERSLVLLGEAGHEPGMSRKCLGSVSEASRKGDVGRCGEMWGDVGRW